MLIMARKKMEIIMVTMDEMMIMVIIMIIKLCSEQGTNRKIRQFIIYCISIR
jgi:hypothetical protein